MDDPDLSDIENLRGRIPVDDLLRAFSNPPARYATYYLQQQEDATLDEVADVVTGWLYSDADGIATPSERDEVKTALYHVHLPVLDDLGAVQFDADEMRVEVADASEAMETLIEWTRALNHEGFEDEVL